MNLRIRHITVSTIIWAIVLLLSASCRKEPVPTLPDLPVTYSNVSGTWQLESWRGAPLSEGTWCYIGFTRGDRTFSIHQNLDSMYDRVLTGKYAIRQDDEGRYLLSGSYDWGAGDWASDYYVDGMSHDGSHMRWTATDDSADVSIYVRVDTIPDFE